MATEEHNSTQAAWWALYDATQALEFDGVSLDEIQREVKIAFDEGFEKLKED